MKRFVYFASVIALLFSCKKGEDYGSTMGSMQYSEGHYPGGEQYDKLGENPFIDPSDQPVSTFGLDPDGASFANVRRMLNNGQKVNPDAIRVEEFINYFPFDYAQPSGDVPVAFNGEITSCPWDSTHKLVRIGMQGYKHQEGSYPQSNWVFLVDVSGSMSGRLNLVKKGLSTLADKMHDEDVISLVTYAGSDRIIFEEIKGSNRAFVKKEIEKLSSGGGTNGAAGINTAYKIAEKHFKKGGNNRVVLVTDGDFNVGVSSREGLINLIEKKRESGVFLSCIGVGWGNYSGTTMENLSNKGNGTYDYLDSEAQAQKVFSDEYGKFFAIAKDVKIQVEFNPLVVSKYRLIGYENRLLKEEDFENDSADAGDLNSNQSVTALYEIEPKNTSALLRSLEIRFRYKNIGEDQSKLITLDLFDNGTPFEKASENTRFAAGIAAFGMQLMGSSYKGKIDFPMIKEIISNASSFDPNSYRSDALALIKNAELQQ